LTVWTPAELKANVPDAVMLVTRSVRERAEKTLGYPVVASTMNVKPATKDVVVIGGGTLIDEVKVWRWKRRPDVKLYAAASIWGSGAEASKIAVLNRETKEIYVDDKLRPDVRINWPELGETVSAELARDACGDAMSHAFEALVSPVASDAIRAEAAKTLNRMLTLPLAYNTEWFELSAKACELQASSSVGVVHGIAHVLEMGALTTGTVTPGLTHAHLCSTYLLPVLDYDNSKSEKVKQILEKQGVADFELRARFTQLHDAAFYQTLLPKLEKSWTAVVKDRCTRTNPALVTMDSLGFFKNWKA